jgi:hypothetical protein
MIISTNSIFRRIPIVLIPEQITVFNAILHSVDICEVTFNRLEDNLYKIAFNPKGNNLVPIIFSDVWSIINNAIILKNIIKKHFNIDESDLLIKGFKKLEGLRHSNQHLDERINQVKSIENLPPIYGAISWYSKKEEKDENGVLTVIYSGTHVDKTRIIPENPAGKINPKKVNHIKFTGIERKGMSDDFFETSVYINSIIDDIKKLIDHFEIQIEEHSKITDFSIRHNSSLIFQLEIIEIEKH